MPSPRRKRSLSASPSDDASRSSGAHKRGKRIVMLLQQQHDASTRSKSPQTTERPPLISSISHPSIATAPILTDSRASLLEVPGLTRQKLDDCISAFFAYIEPMYRLSQPRDQFVSRVRVLMYNIAGVDIPLDLSNVDAASELLVLAVAFMGAPHAHPGLTQALFEQCRVLSTQSGYLDDVSVAVDNVEALYLMDGAGPQAPGTHHPLMLNPLARGYAIDLAMYHKLNLPPPLVNGKRHPEYERRRSLYHHMFEADALRSVCAGLPFRLADIKKGWSILSPDNHLTLANVARYISTRALSAKSRVQGIREDDLTMVTCVLDRDDLPPLSESAPSAEAIYLHSVRNTLCLVLFVAAAEAKLSPQVVAKFEDLAVKALDRMECLAELIKRSHLVRTIPRAVRDYFAAFVLFKIRKLREREWSVSGALPQLYIVDTLCGPVREASGFEDSERIAEILGGAAWEATRKREPPCLSRDDVALLTGLAVPRFLLEGIV